MYINPGDQKRMKSPGARFLAHASAARPGARSPGTHVILRMEIAEARFDRPPDHSGWNGFIVRSQPRYGGLSGAGSCDGTPCATNIGRGSDALEERRISLADRRTLAGLHGSAPMEV
jgi:hypothetical protein